MDYNQNLNSVSSFYKAQTDMFPKQLQEVLTKKQFASYNHLVSVWKRVGEKTSLSVFPIFEALSKLFSGIQWCGKFGGLKTAYEIYVPKKFLKDYMRAMFSENPQSMRSPFEQKLIDTAQKIDLLSPNKLKNVMAKANSVIFLREKVFYSQFPLHVIDDISKCQDIWSKASANVRNVLCFDQNSVNEMSIFLRIEASEIRESLKRKEAKSQDSVQKVNVPKTPKEEENISAEREQSSSEFELNEEELKADEELQRKLKKFEEDVLGLKSAPLPAQTESPPKQPQLEEESPKKDSVPKKAKKPPKRGKRGKKGKKNRWDNSDGGETLDGSALFQNMAGKQLSHRGPLVVHSDEEPATAQGDYLQNFNEADFVPDAPAEVPEEDRSSFAFLQQYNAAEASSERKEEGFRAGNTKGTPEEALGDVGDQSKGFYDPLGLKSYEEKISSLEQVGAEALGGDAPAEQPETLQNADLAHFGQSVQSPPDSPAEEAEEGNAQKKEVEEDEARESDWIASLKRNEKIRTRNTFQSHEELLTDPLSVDSSCFDSRGEFLASFFKTEGGEVHSNPAGKANLAKETSHRSELKAECTPKTGALAYPCFRLWECSCGSRNSYEQSKCAFCDQIDRPRHKTRLRKGVVESYNRKKGFGFVSEGRGKKKLRFPRYAVWSADNAVYPGEKVLFRTFFSAKGVEEISQLTGSARARRKMIGRCVRLNAEEDFGWIRLSRSGNRKGDIFFALSDYESGQDVFVGMDLRFVVDLVAEQPRAFSVRPLLEYSNDSLGPKEDFAAKKRVDFSAARTNSVFKGKIIEWRDNYGYIQPEEGTDRVMVSSDAAYTTTRVFSRGDSVEFCIDVSDVSKTGHINAKQAVKVDPHELFYGRISSADSYCGFIEPEFRWMTKSLYFKMSQAESCKEDLVVGVRVQFYLAFSLRGCVAQDVKVVYEGI